MCEPDFPVKDHFREECKESKRVFILFFYGPRKGLKHGVPKVYVDGSSSVLRRRTVSGRKSGENSKGCVKVCRKKME